MATAATSSNFFAYNTATQNQAAAGASSKDPFNWPMPSRKDLMSLSSIN